MPARSILHWPNPLLKRKSILIEDIGESELRLAKDLSDTMKVAFGAGLAASQVGDQRSMVVISGDYSSSDTLPPDPILKNEIVLVNPRIEILSGEKYEWEEACLSVPDYSDIVSRFTDIRLEYQDLSGNSHTKNLTAPFSGIVQHEVDHLFGILYLDRLSSSKKRKARDLLLSRKRKQAAEIKKKAKAEKRQKEEVETRHGFRPAGSKSSSKRKKRSKQFGKNKRRKK